MFGLVAQWTISVYWLFNYTIAAGRPAISVPNQFALPYIVDIMSLGSSASLFVTRY